MPPVPSKLAVPPARRSISSVTSATTEMSVAFGFLRGSSVYRPSTSERITSRSASTRCATIPARLSLSPKRISSTATVSFSLMIGTTPNPSRAVSVCRELRNRARFVRSSRVSSTCATFTPSFSNAFSYAHISRLWPTAAAACLIGRLLGYSLRPSFSMPEMIAPEDTIRMSLFCVFNSASSAAKRSSRSVCRPSPLEATRLLPTFSTTRRASLRIRCRIIRRPPHVRAHAVRLPSSS